MYMSVLVTQRGPHHTLLTGGNRNKKKMLIRYGRHNRLVKYSVINKRLIKKLSYNNVRWIAITFRLIVNKFKLSKELFHV